MICNSYNFQIRIKDRLIAECERLNGNRNWCGYEILNLKLISWISSRGEIDFSVLVKVTGQLKADRW